jgi:hypothetical protein
MPRLRQLFQQSVDRRGVLLFTLSAVAAVLTGFVLIPSTTAERLIVAGGYYYVLTVFVLWIVFGWRVVAARRATWGDWLRRPGWAGIGLLAATGFAVWSDGFAYKIMFDEYVLQGTAWHLHLTKEVGTPIRAFDIQGSWLVVDAFLDKRPYFFAFLVSLLHDLTGFRLGNVYALNVALAFTVLATTGWLVRVLTGRRAPAFLAVALVATLPLFGQNATGAGMELLNLAMISLTIMAATLYLRAPGPDRLSFLVLGAVLLAQSRYESVLFVFPVAVVAVLGWLRAERVLLPWPALIAPLLLTPYVWHDRFVATKPVLWQLREGESARFAWHYLAGNLEGAGRFFFSVSPSQPNSLWLTLVGIAAVAWAAVRLGQRWRTRADLRNPWPPAVTVFGLFAATMAANLGLLMFYYWSRLDEPIASRFALPIYVALAATAGWGVGSFERRGFPAARVVGIGLAAWLLVCGAPAYAHRFYTEQNMVMHELNWEIEQVTARPQPVLLITAKATMPFLIRKVSALNTSIARVRGPQLTWHLRAGTFHEVLVSQVMRPTSARGEAVVDPDEELPANFRLRTLAEKRFGARWIRLSRLVEVTAANESEVGRTGTYQSVAPALSSNARQAEAEPAVAAVTSFALRR